MNFSFWPFFWFGLLGRPLNRALQNTAIVYLSLCTYTYIFFLRERERESARTSSGGKGVERLQTEAPPNLPLKEHLLWKAACRNLVQQFGDIKIKCQKPDMTGGPFTAEGFALYTEEL